MLDLFLLCLADHKNVIQLINQHFFKRLIFGFLIDALKKFFKIINIWQNWHSYTLQMINLDNVVNDNNKKHNKKWSHILDNPYRILIIVGSESGKTNTLLNSINE